MGFSSKDDENFAGQAGVKDYQLVYLPSAEKDLLSVFDYIKADSPGSAAEWLDNIERSLKRLMLFPRSGSLPRDSYLQRKGYRIIVVGDYLAFYKVKGETVQIHRFIHGKRRHTFLL